jgi:hypothetical protein
MQTVITLHQYRFRSFKLTFYSLKEAMLKTRRKCTITFDGGDDDVDDYVTVPLTAII